MRTDMSRNDVEKRWHDPAAFRAAAEYVVSVIALASLSFALFVLIGQMDPIVVTGNAASPSGRRDRSVHQDLPSMASRPNMARLAGRRMVSADIDARQPEHPRNGAIALSDESPNWQSSLRPRPTCRSTERPS